MTVLDNDRKEILIKDFRTYLETGDELEENQGKENRHIDLLTLLRELVALKTEVKN